MSYSGSIGQKQRAAGNIRAAIFVLGLLGLASALFFLMTSRKKARRQTAPPSAELAGLPHELIEDSGLFFLGVSAYSGSASYALHTDEGTIVIDPGFTFTELKKAFDLAGLDVAQVKIVLITHQHADHWFAARELVRRSDAIVMAHREEIPNLTEAADLQQYYACYPTTIKDIPVLDEVRPLEDGDKVQLGGHTIAVIATPGHTRGSVCYQSEIRGQRVLWSGDTVLAVTRDPVGGDYMTRLGPELGGNMQDYLTSLLRLHSIPVDVILPGHPRYGTSQDSRVGRVGWKNLLQPSIDRLDGWLKGHEHEAALYLDGTPKPLTPDVLYLGERNNTACYVLKTSAGAICVDPGQWPPAELLAAISDIAQEEVQVKMVLLTATHHDHGASAQELCRATGAELVVGATRARNDKLEPARIVRHGESLTCGDLTLAALDCGGGVMSYRTRISGYEVLIGGDNVGRFPLGLNEKSHPDSPPPDLVAERRFYQRLKQDKVDIVLPAHPHCQEAPFYLPGEWTRRTRDW